LIQIPNFNTLKYLQKIKAYFLRHKIKTGITLVLLFLYWLWLPSTLFNKPCSTVLVDENGQLLAAQIASDGQWRFPQMESVPLKFEKCITHFEDEYFFYHPGFNPVAIFKSFKRNTGAGKIKSGGSTITMQIARMMRGNQNRNYYQKIVELLLAVRIECSYKKSSILKVYASNAPFGTNVVGLSAASWRYFGRSPEKLSWAESALLAVLPNSPSLIYPGRNHDALIKKRDRLLKKLFEKKIIDESTYNLSLTETLPEKPFPLPQMAPHLLSRCITEHGSSKIYHSSIRKSLQTQVNAIINKHVQNLSANDIHNACALVAETETGRIIAYVGNSSHPKNEFQNYVDVVHSPRSTGSILKPFLYAFLLNENKILPKSLIEDIPTQIGSYGPKNFNLTYDGLVPANEAIARSLNIPAVKMLQDYGPAKFHFQLKQLGFKTFTKPTTHYGLSLILGGGEANLHEIASAYASMGRALMHYNNTSGKYAVNSYFPLSYLEKETPEIEQRLKSDVLKVSSVWFTFNAMTELLRPQDYVGWMQFLSKNRVAWKTGTSFGFRDAWAVGLDSKYTVAVWVGNADGEGRPNLTGTSAAAPIMFNIFNILSQKKWFTKPDKDIIKQMVCKQSGYKASEICPDKIEQEVPSGSEKTKQCPFHKLIHLDETGQYRVNSNCYPVDKMKHVPWFIASPAQEYFFKQHNLFYRSIPSYLEACQNELSYRQLDIIYPREGFKVYNPVGESGKAGNCVFKATHKNVNTTVFWHLDGNYIGSTQKFHQLSLLPGVGKHVLSLTDSEGETAMCKFEVIGK
jgi:penicillin-binding protein 1C